MLGKNLVQIQKEVKRRTRIEQELLFIQRRLIRLLDLAQQVIFSLNHQWQITFFNRAAEQWSGYSAMEILGQSIERLLPNWPIETIENQLKEPEEEPHRPLSFQLPLSTSSTSVEISMIRLELNSEHAYAVLLEPFHSKSQTQSPSQVSFESPTPATIK